MGLGAGLRQEAANTEASRAPEVPRRSLALPWLIALVVIPLSIAAIGYGGFDRQRSAAGAADATPTLAPTSTPAAPKLSLAPLSITRNGNDFTLSGDLPDDSAKAQLMKALRDSLPPGVNIIDEIHINPNVDALDFAKAAALFRDSAPISDFSLTVNQNAIILAGTAASQDQKNTVSQDAVRAWPNLNVVDRLAVSAPLPPPAPLPSPPAPPPPPAPPAPPAAAGCIDLQSAINAVTGGPIAFGNDGVSLTPADTQILTQVSDKLKACPTARAAINGYSDNSGAEAIVIPLSAQRAQRVADFLVAHGVAGSQLAVKGLGPVNFIAPNDTPDGRAKNRRVEIVVS